MSQTVMQGALDAEVGEAAAELRLAYAALLSSLPGCTSAIDVERALGLNKKLAWQVYRVACADEPLEAGIRGPGPAATRQVVKAAQRHGVPAAVSDQVVASSDRFQRTIARHADDRSSFELMMSAVTNVGMETRDRDLKRAAFRANRQLVGKYCDADVFSLIVVPGTQPGAFDMCSLRGLVDLRRLRPKVGLEISRHRYDFTGGEVQQREAVDPEAQADDGAPISLLRRFCSQPIPRIRQLQCADGFVRSFAETDRIGLQSAVTCFLSDVTRNSDPSTSGDRQRAIGSIHEVTTPAHVLFVDCLIDERIVGDSMPAFRVLASRRDADVWPGDDESVLLPVQESVKRIGTGASAVTTPEVPQYPAMIEYLTSHLDWDADRLVLFRSRIEFPVLHSVAWMRFGSLADW